MGRPSESWHLVLIQDLLRQLEDVPALDRLQFRVELLFPGEDGLDPVVERALGLAAADHDLRDRLVFHRREEADGHHHGEGGEENAEDDRLAAEDDGQEVPQAGFSFFRSVWFRHAASESLGRRMDRPAPGPPTLNAFHPPGRG